MLSSIPRSPGIAQQGQRCSPNSLRNACGVAERNLMQTPRNTGRWDIFWPNNREKHGENLGHLPAISLENMGFTMVYHHGLVHFWPPCGVVPFTRPRGQRWSFAPRADKTAWSNATLVQLPRYSWVNTSHVTMFDCDSISLFHLDDLCVLAFGESCRDYPSLVRDSRYILMVFCTTILIWLVVYRPLWKMMDFVSWDYYSQLNGKS